MFPLQLKGQSRRSFHSRRARMFQKVHGRTFWTRKGKAFYYVWDFSKCITLHPKDHEYSKVVVEVDDKEAVAKELKKALWFLLSIPYTLLA